MATKARRIDLAWGGGDFDVLVNLRTAEVIKYASDKDAGAVHRKYGGLNYYVSRSGMSGAGWVPAHPALRTASTYRVDSYPWKLDLSKVSDTAPGIKLMVPIDYRQDIIPDGWPIAAEVASGGNAVFMVTRWNLGDLLLGNQEAFGEKTVSFRVVLSPVREPTEVPFIVRVHRDARFNVKQALVRLFNDRLSFKMDVDQGGESARTNPFWYRLGLWQIEGHLHKVAQNVCWARYARQDLGTVEALQKVSPANVQVLTPSLYLQEAESGFEAVGLFEIDGEEVEFELRLELPEAVRAMRGEYADVLTRLETGAREKITQERELRRQAEQWATEQAEQEARLRELIEKFADLEVALEDSLVAGNCEPGTLRFRDEHFPGRDRVTVRELAQFLDVAGVRHVLLHKLVPLVKN